MDRDKQAAPAAAAPEQAPARRARSKGSVVHVPVVQAKLVVGSATDSYEQEADAVAERVIQRLTSPATSADGMAAGVSIARKIQRNAAPRSSTVARSSGSADSKVRGNGAPIGAEGGSIDGDLERRVSSAQGGGAPLAPKVRRSMEGAFGADFSGVRVHSGGESADLNQRLGASAFTVGNDIFFRGATPSADSVPGQRLLAHELTHTIQQRSSPVARKVQRMDEPSTGAAAAADPEAPVIVKGSIGESVFGPGPTDTEDPGTMEADRTGAGTTRSSAASATRESAPRSAPSTYRVMVTDLGVGTTVKRLATMPSSAMDDDAVAATVTTATNVTGGRTVKPFGSLNRSWKVAVPAYTLKSAESVNSVEIAASFTQNANYGTNSGGNIDVPSGTDPVVTAESYQKIISDLTPIATELSWVATREKYWSQAICERHEKFHADDVKAFGDGTGKEFVKNYLNGKTLTFTPEERADPVAVAAKVQELVDDARSALQTATSQYMRGPDGNTYYSYPGEQRAFGDGKAYYQALVAAVKAQGEKLVAAKKAAETPPPSTGGTGGAATGASSTPTPTAATSV